MKRALFSIAVLFVLLTSTGCLCNPCGGRMIGGCGSGAFQGMSYGNGGACDACVDDGGCGTVGGYGQYGPPCYPVATNCTRHLMNAVHSVGQLAVDVVSLPINLVGGILNWGSCGIYHGCGCSSEVYYGDNCTPGGCEPCESGCGGGYQTGCAHCAGGYAEGIAPVSEGEVQVVPSKNVRYVQPSDLQYRQARQMPTRSVQQVVYQR